MTVPNTNTRNGPYYPNGATVAFPFSFRALDKSDVAVVRVDTLGLETPVSDADFNVNLTTNGGTVMFAIPPAAGNPLYVQLSPTFEQEISFENEGAFLPEVLTEALDRSAQRSLFLRDLLSRTILSPIGEAPLTLPSIAGRAGRFFAFDALGVPIAASGSGADGALRSDLAASAGAINGVKPERIGGLPYRLDDSFKFSIRLTAFGWKGDGVTDDTNAWRAAIAFAGARKIATIIVPNGVSLVTDQIVNAANPLPPGLTFEGEGPRAGNYAVLNCIKYTGSGICWDIDYPTGAPANTGKWTWNGVGFNVTNPAGTMFSFGNPLRPVVSDDPMADPHQFIVGVRFLNILALGAQGTSRFVQACKTFEFYVDSVSEVYSFARAFWMRGCDNIEIRARMVGNNRGSMTQAAGVFGNNGWVDLHTISGAGGAPFGGEPGYDVWDDTSKLTIGKGTMFEGDGQRACMYLNGFGTVIDSPQFGTTQPMFELGPLAREVVMYSPRTTTINTGRSPIIAVAANPNLGSQGFDYRMRIVDAPLPIQAVLPVNPRIIQIGKLRNPARNAPDAFMPLEFGSTGSPVQSHICTAYNYWATPGAPGGGGITEMYSDAALNGGYAMRLTKDTPVEQGMSLNFVMGVDIWPGVYQVLNRMRLASGVSNAGWALIMLVNGAFFSNAFNYATSTGYTTYRDSIDLTGVALGSPVSINLYNFSAGATGVDLFVQALGLIPVSDGGWTAGTGVANKAAFAAYGGQSISAAYTQAEVQAVANAARDSAQRVLALEQTLRRLGVIN